MKAKSKLTSEKPKEYFDRGQEKAKSGDYRGAWAAYVDALNSVPDPDYDQPITLEILKCMGELQFKKPDFAKALKIFSDAVRCRGGLGDAQVHLRLGQCYLEHGDFEHAQDNLARAYMGGGREIFGAEDDKYFEYLKTVLKPPAGRLEL